MKEKGIIKIKQNDEKVRKKCTWKIRGIKRKLYYMIKQFFVEVLSW